MLLLADAAAQGTLKVLEVSKSPWTPELLAGLGVLLTAILTGLGKLIVDVKAGNKVTEEVKTNTERVLIVSDGRLTAVMKTNARLASAIARLTKDPTDIQAAKDAEEDLVKKYDQDIAQGIKDDKRGS